MAKKKEERQTERAATCLGGPLQNVEYALHIALGA